MGMYCHVHAVDPTRLQEMLDRLDDPEKIVGLIDRSASSTAVHLEKSCFF